MEGKKESETLVPEDDRAFVNVLVMSVGFFFVFGGYNPVQNFASSLLNFECLPVGDISIGIVYLAGAVSSLVAPALVRRHGARACMVAASTGFMVFAGSVSYIVIPVVLTVSFLVGLCGALLNVAQGVALGRCVTDRTRGLYSGIFQAFNQGASLPGNLVAIFLIPPSANTGAPRPCGNTTESLLIPGWDPVDGPLFVGCGGCCLLGTLTLALYTTPRGTGKRDLALPKLPLGRSLRRLWAACTRPGGIRLLLPLIVYTGFSIVFYSGMFTRQMPSGWVGPAMCILGGGEIAGGLLVGLLTDRLGPPVTFALLVLVQGGALALAYLANAEQDRTYFWAAAAMLGVADNGAQTIAYAMLSNRFPDRATAVLRVSQRSDDCDTDTLTPRSKPNRALVVDSIDQSIQHGPDEKTTDSVETGEWAPLLGPKGVTPGEEVTLDSSVGFSAYILVQSITVAVLFFSLPLAAGESGQSSKRQFLYEEAATLGVMVLAAVCLAVDGGGRQSQGA